MDGLDSGPKAQVGLWNARTGIFDGSELRAAIVMRGWTVPEFICASGVSRGSLYHALLGYGVSDRTAIRIFQTLKHREPLLIL